MSRLTVEELGVIGKLAPNDQKLAKQQVLCPVTKEPLGSMGVPLKVMVKNQPIFVCCKACARAVEKDAEAMLELVNRWRSENQKGMRTASP